MTNSMNNLVNAVDHAAMQNDRWWVAAMAILLIGFIVISGRWLVRKHEQLIAQSRTDQLAYEAKLEAIITKGNETATTLAVAMERNSCAIDSNTEVLSKCTEELRECRSARSNGRHS